MMTPNHGYKNVDFTHHARDRMRLRAISEDMVLKAIRQPDRSILEDDGDTRFIRDEDGLNLQVVCKPLPDEDAWLVKSTWVRGEDDEGHRVDRYGHILGPRRRPAPRLAWVIPLIIVAIIIALVLLYVLTR